MSFRNTAILVVVLTALGAVVFFMNRGGGEGVVSDATPTPAPVTSLTRSDVATVTVQEGDQSVVVERQGDGWVIVGEQREPAGGDKVNRAVDDLAQLRPTRTLTDVDNLDDFGLAEPVWTIELTPTEGDSVVLQVGDENPQATARYLRVAGDSDILLVPKSAVENVRGWLETPPYPPTPTPEPTATAATTPSPAASPAADLSPTAVATPAAPDLTPTP